MKIKIILLSFIVLSFTNIKGQPYYQITDLKYKQIADSILKSKTDFNFMQSVVCFWTVKGFYKMSYWTEDSIIVDESPATYYGVRYELKNKCEQKYGNKFKLGGWAYPTSINFTFDENLNLVQEPDYEQILKVVLPYEVCYISLNEAQKIAKQNSKLGFRKTWTNYLLNDYTNNRVVWLMEREKGFMKCTVQTIEIDATTGIVLNTDEYPLRKRFFEALSFWNN
ncbi:hypothetical protein FACS18945_0590 [Bacteroidia bacterium]|nr:hypothetical protein FACS189434_12970 [Bacteroidia bacterium]GHT57113.1 hypothetical protein FACS18945_0590 [Bacteroidia bacterium]